MKSMGFSKKWRIWLQFHLNDCKCKSNTYMCIAIEVCVLLYIASFSFYGVLNKIIVLIVSGPFKSSQ